ncbi:MAG: hypothetical protein CVT95_06020 [Bacteroidetes bacterium HGW-Bacteroidetes-12]|nr:MAG: hypothetical protein CVT95_06020 [Bacteroidetes bacterium HGW-Bacteroidetes-12]
MRYFKNILLSILVFGVFALHPSMNKQENPFSYLHYLAYGNSLKLKYDSTIDKNQITIKWICEKEAISCKEIIIMKDGRKLNSIPFEIGKQQLVVFYQNKMVGTIQQNKLVKNQAHSYYLELIANELLNSIEFKGTVFGPAASDSYSLTTTNLERYSENIN